MLKRIFSITLFTLFATVGFSQTPRPVKTSNSHFNNQPESVLACLPGQGNEAGTVSLGPFMGSSNDIDFDTMYLCINDQILIDHDAGSASFLGDPITSSPSGIGYAVYDSPPTGAFNGDLVTIQSDPFLTSNPPPPVGSELPWIATPPNTSGDLLFINTGNFQGFFGGGAPILKWFAPITYDSLDVDNLGIGTAHFEGTPDGPCVDVNEQEAFAVVYLNEINFSNLLSTYDVNGSPSNCGGTFTISGGLPEFEPNAIYDFNITRVGNPMDIGQVVSGSATNGETVEFKINVPGIYNISVTDGKGCPADTTINITGCPAMEITAGNETALTGTQVCVPFTVTDFTDIFSFQFTVEWDATVLQFASVNAISLNQNDLLTNPTSNTLAFTFFDFNLNPITLNDGDVAFEVCFNVIGPAGSSSPISITDNSNVTIFDVNSGLVGLIPNSGSVTVINSSTFDIGITSTDETCFGENDGSFTVAINGTGNGTAPYNVTWAEVGNAANSGTLGPLNNNGLATQSNLSPGEYALVTTDSDMPAQTQLDTVNIIAAPNIGASLLFDEATCSGGTDGVVYAIFSVNSVAVSDYTGYTFVWDPDPNGAAPDPQSIMDFSISTTYAVTITAPNGCSRTASGSGTTPAPLDIDFNVLDASCSGIDDGAITATPSGGPFMATYTYEWSTTPTQTTPTINNLALGAYTLTITDSGGCTYEESVIVGAATEIFSGATIQDVTCNGADDGSISFLPQVNGVNNGGYTYQWSPGVSATSNANSLPPDTYYDVTITDALGCNIDTSIIISEPTPLEIVGAITVTDETCAMMGNDGTATATVTGGTPLAGGGYTFNWSSSPGQTGDLATGIAAGNYTLEVTDANNCMTTTPYIINPPMPPMIVGFDSTSVQCPTDMNGSLTVNAMEGNATIVSYNWTFPNGSTSTGQTIDNIGAGTYTVTVVAMDGCEATESASLFAPQPLEVIPSVSVANPSCYGLDNGTAAVQVFGGTMPFNFQWSSNTTGATNTAVASNLLAGTYTVTVSDGCGQTTQQFILEDPDSISIVFDNIVPATCNGVTVNCDGQATALASGGNAPSAIYTFQWSMTDFSVGMTGMSDSLCAGNANVTVTDETGCFNIASVPIPEPLPLEFAPTITPPTCNGDTDGAIEGGATGGTSPYTYLWEDNSTGPVFENIGEGNWEVTITDMNGCTSASAVTLFAPDELVAEIDTINTKDITCFGNADGIIVVEFSGGNAGDVTYTWSANASTGNSNTATGLSQDLYTITVTDSKGCTSIVQEFIDEPDDIFPTIFDWEDPICNGDQTLITVDTAEGGTGVLISSFSFSIDGGPNQNIGNLIDVFAGPHEIVITDSIGCTHTENITINEPLPVTVDLGPDLEIQLGETVQLQANLSSNVILDSLIWIPTILDTLCLGNCLTPTVTPNDDILYTIEVFDVDGCNGSDQILIEVDKNRNVFIPNVFTPNGDGYNDIFNIFSGPGVSRINSVQIFDRWGEIVFQANGLMPSSELDYANSWDGRLNGKVLNPGVFVYLIEVTFDDGIKLLYRGDLTLLH